VRSVLVLGGSGLVGARLVELWAGRVDVRAPSHGELDVLDDAALSELIRQSGVEVVVNLAAWADVDGAEAERGDESGLVYRLNALYPGRLAELCASHDKYLVHVSTDYVFDGEQAARPYRENDPTNPLCWYARTKLDGELQLHAANRSACIARIEMPFTARPHRKRDFARTCLARLESGQELMGVTDQRITPVFLDDAVEALARLAEQRVSGTVHVAAASWTTPYEFARSIAHKTGHDPELVRPTNFESFASQRPARRPRHSWLDVRHAQTLVGPGVLRPIGEQLDAFAAQLLSVPSQV
jgi:dTDP-4-dehydrorhamnose reductase